MDVTPPTPRNIPTNPQKDLSDIKANTSCVRAWPGTSREQGGREPGGGGVDGGWERLTASQHCNKLAFSPPPICSLGLFI